VRDERKKIWGGARYFSLIPIGHATHVGGGGMLASDPQGILRFFPSLKRA
jgi:hypothetical protein